MLMRSAKKHRRGGGSFPQEVYRNRVMQPCVTAALDRYNRVASLCSVEACHPLLDRRIVDSCARLPCNQFVRNGWPKFLFRKVAEQFLPPEVCWRTGQEHVGWSFTEALMEAEKDKFHNLQRTHQKTLTKYIKREFFSFNDKVRCISDENSINPTLAGLSLWLQDHDISQNLFNGNTGNHENREQRYSTQTLSETDTDQDCQSP